MIQRKGVQKRKGRGERRGRYADNGKQRTLDSLKVVKNASVAFSIAARQAERGLRFLAGQFYCRCLTTNAAEPLALQPTESAYVSSKPWRVMGRASGWGTERGAEEGTFDRSFESFPLPPFFSTPLPAIFLSSVSLWFWLSLSMVWICARLCISPSFFPSSNEIEGSSFVSTRESASYIPRVTRRGLTLLLLISSRLFRARALPAYE